jgi:ATP-dependent helicase HrpB
MPTSLPIDEIKDSLLDALNVHPTLILTAPPGAGKSTRLPLWLITLASLSQQKIYLLQPRRIAAKNIACYLAQQLNESVGQTVGYRLRNESKVSKNTRLEVITEGILTQIIQNDPELIDCGLIVFDEFHERSLHGDLAFALARDIQQNLREDLKILLMSATLSIKTLLDKIPDAVTLHSEGRSYPVEIEYLPMLSSRQSTVSTAQKWREHALNVIKKQSCEHQGSILVFLPGVADIQYLANHLHDYLPDNMLLSPLYGELSITEQQRAIAPAEKGINKLVLATNIAETSLTIEGINLVIDCGLEKVALYDPHVMTNKLQQQSISKASAIQRAGRAGRLMAGSCLRLYSKEDFERRNESNTSEIQQADLLPMLIESARWGVRQLNKLPLVELPIERKEVLAWQELKALSIVDSNNRLTIHGQQVAALACHPRFAHMVITAKHIEKKYNVKHLLALACLLSALLEERDIFKGERARFDADIRHRLAALLSKKEVHHTVSKRIFHQAQQLARQLNCQLHDKLPIEYSGNLLALAFPERIAKFRGKAGEYQTTQGKGVYLALEDALINEEYLVAAQLSIFKGNHQNNHREKLEIRLAAPADINTLEKWQVIQCHQYTKVAFDAKKDRIVALEQMKLNELVIAEKSVSERLSAQQISNLWCEQISNQGLQVISWSEKDKALLTRWRWLNQYQKNANFPDVSDQSLLNNLSTWLAPYVGKARTKAQLCKCDFSVMLLSLLDYQQKKRLDTLAPTYFLGPTGRKCPIRYTQDRSPIVSLPMQELYGINITPSIGDTHKNEGIALILEILSPRQRPIQVTQDLVAFWQGSYKAVQKDMKAQYPKHYWPDDPANAKATNRVKRHLKDIK